MIEDMTMRKFPARTQEGYIRAVKGFSAFLGAASFEDLRRYQLHLVSTGTGAPTINHTTTALRFLFMVPGQDRSSFDFLVMDQRRRRGCQHARFARRLVGQRGVRNQLLGNLPFRCEQRLGCLTRSCHPLAIIAARVRVLPSAKQELLRKVGPFATSKGIL